ncbi:MAG: heme-binding protein [Nitriliruptoraceae bacterium]|nr:heme-binding protein [Nitriliruptoraceae bacterium]
MTVSVTRLSIDDARLLLAGAAIKSAEIGVPMCTAITDESGGLLAFEREDGGKPTSIDIAIDKAYTGARARPPPPMCPQPHPPPAAPRGGAGARRPTRFYQQNTRPDGPTWGIHVTNQGRFCIIPGGLPVEIDGVVVGGIGCSSGTADEDEIVAQAAIDHFMAHRG